MTWTFKSEVVFQDNEIDKSAVYRALSLRKDIDKFQDSVLLSMKEAGVRLENAVGNDFEIDERIFSAEEILPVAVVAEDKNQYGADAFEEYMKNDVEEVDAPVTETHSLNAPKSPIR